LQRTNFISRTRGGEKIGDWAGTRDCRGDTTDNSSGGSAGEEAVAARRCSALLNIVGKVVLWKEPRSRLDYITQVYSSETESQLLEKRQKTERPKAAQPTMGACCLLVFWFVVSGRAPRELQQPYCVPASIESSRVEQGKPAGTTCAGNQTRTDSPAKPLLEPALTSPSLHLRHRGSSLILACRLQRQRLLDHRQNFPQLQKVPATSPRPESSACPRRRGAPPPSS